MRNRKTDTDLQIVQKIARKEIKKAGLKVSETSGGSFGGSYKFIPGGGGTNFGGNDGTGSGNNYFEAINDPMFWMISVGY